MIKLFSLVSLLIAFSFTKADTELTQQERDDAVKYSKESLKALEKEINGLSENQLNWRPADSVWSAADCVEHLALAEKNLFDWAMGSLKEEANPAKRSELKMNDDAVKKLITDRSFKVKTREGFIPSGQFGTAWESLGVLKERRASTINYIMETKDDLRNHFVELPFGWIDTYQSLLFMSGHTLRHTAQITELKTLPGFPKK